MSTGDKYLALSLKKLIIFVTVNSTVFELVHNHLHYTLTIIIVKKTVNEKAKVYFLRFLSSVLHATQVNISTTMQ